MTTNTGVQTGGKKKTTKTVWFQDENVNAINGAKTGVEVEPIHEHVEDMEVSIDEGGSTNQAEWSKNGRDTL